MKLPIDKSYKAILLFLFLLESGCTTPGDQVLPTQTVPLSTVHSSSTFTEVPSTPTSTVMPTSSSTKVIPILDTLPSGQYLVISVFEGFAPDGLTPINSLLVLGMNGRIYGQLAKYDGDPGALSHNQDKIAYLADRSHIMSFDLKTGERQVLANLEGHRCNSPISWANNDKSIVLSCEGRIFIVSIDTGIVEEMTVGSKKNVWVDPIWSPDGRLIAFDHLPGIPQSSPDEGLYIVNTSCLQDPSTCMDVAKGPFTGSFMCPNCMSWSPDGRFLAYTDAMKISILDSKTNQTREIIIPESDYDPESLTWSPDGEWIAYTLLKVTGNDPQTEVFLVSVDGERVVQFGAEPKNRDKISAFWLEVP
jgi:Tol biopolymer transport system component